MKSCIIIYMCADKSAYTWSRNSYQMDDPQQQQLVPDNYVPSTISTLVHRCPKVIPNKCVLVRPFCVVHNKEGISAITILLFAHKQLWGFVLADCSQVLASKTYLTGYCSNVKAAYFFKCCLWPAVPSNYTTCVCTACVAHLLQH